MTQTTFPLFRLACGAAPEAAAVLGTVTRTTQGSETWVGDGWLGYLMAGLRLVHGRWRRQGESWLFAPLQPEDVRILLERPEWMILDGHWGPRAALVLDGARRWEERTYAPRDAMRWPTESGAMLAPLPPASDPDADDDHGAPGELIHTGWDHDHCEICGEKLGAGGQSCGFFSAPYAWVCAACHSQFVQTRSLGFIPPARP